MKLDREHILVVGLGASGLAAARLLRKQGARVTINDAKLEGELGTKVQEARNLGCDLQLGHHDSDLFIGVDRIVLSPGVPPLPALDAADRAGIPIASEIELASWFIESFVVGITGTNGKSTVTTLVGEMGKVAGRPTFVGGNLGTPLVDVVGTDAAQPGGLVVVELSSFQLERVDRFHADVAVLLNVSPDHLDRYPSYAAYAAAKARIFHGQTPKDAAVIPNGDSECEALAGRGAATRYRFGPGGDVGDQGNAIVDEVTGLRVPLESLRIRGAHNVLNAAAAALAARLAGIEPAAIRSVLQSFPGLPHRMFHVRELAGVAFYDDSKATNVGAAVAAVRGLAAVHARMVLIAGGKHKGGGYEDLKQTFAPHARALVLIGEAAARIESTFSTTEVPIYHASSLEGAVEQAFHLAKPGDGVLLAPACSSYDMFQNYAARGDVFQAAVRGLREAPA